jgi:NAD(P)-dependent dehydrogenase (short-subunit alcohol dehydrogenase family)
MVSVDLKGMTALVTGGTKGLGKATALELTKAGATVFVTHRWGSVDEKELAAEFKKEKLAPPIVLECDASDAEGTRDLMKAIKEKTGRLDIAVSNVAFSKVIQDIKDLKRNSLELSIGYSAWPLVELVQAAHEVLGHYPSYVIGVSSDGGQVCHYGYDFAGVSKSVLETLCRYLALRLKTEGVRVNVIRPGFLDTASSRATFGDAAVDDARKRVGDIFLDTRKVAKVCVALCSGLLDSITGQVIVVDEGWSLVSPMAYLTGKGVPGAFPEGERDGD